nr:unnamed protein product [Callosobruchus chinensis]CAH7761890.1 unnamed protein product [Callosobruchus chinensis]
MENFNWAREDTCL